MLEPINISLDSLNLGTIAPVSIAIIGALGILLTDIFNKNKQFSGWRAQTYTMRYDKRYLIDRYKKAYNLDEEKKSNDIISLTGFPESEAFLIQIYPDKVTFYIEDFNYSFPK